MIHIFDWKYYKYKNKDLVKNNINTKYKAIQHWINHGYNEGRDYKINDDFDWKFYLNIHPDLKDTIDINTDNIKDKVIYHWVKYGYKEGRIYNKKMLNKIPDDFDWKYYLDNYPDLKDNITYDENIEYIVKLHWLYSGRNEGRIISYNNLCKNYNKNLQILEKDNNIIKELFQQLIGINQDNLFNIIIRTSNRPLLFKQCVDSISNQIYKNIKIIISYDSEESLNYLNNYTFEKYYMNIDNKNKYKFNLYCNILLEKVSDGWIIFLDDDDMFSSEYTLSLINDNLKDNNNLVLWKFLRPDKIIYPLNINKIKKGNITNCGYCFHSKFNYLFKWAAVRGGDFNYINGLLNNNSFNKIFLPYILTKTIYNDKISNYGEIDIMSK